MQWCVLRKVCALSGLLLLAASVEIGCAPIDTYSLRAIDYNLEAEQTENQMILLNVARASLHRPLEFSEIQNIVGSNSATGNASFSFPVGAHPASSITTGTAGASLTGSTTFTIPVLDTQDFYEGFLNDIQAPLVAYYLKSTSPHDLVFNLLVERITVTIGDCTPLHAAKCERDFRNNPDNAEDIALFQTMAQFLLGLQISAEEIEQPTKSLQTIKAGSVTINISGTSNSTSAGSAGVQPNATKQYRLCFLARLPGQILVPSILCGAQKSGTSKQKIATTTTIPDKSLKFTQVLARDLNQDIEATTKHPCSAQEDSLLYCDAIRSFVLRKFGVTLQFRSTNSVFGFLGQIVSATDPHRPFSLYAPDFGHPLTPCWLANQNLYRCEPIFSVTSSAVPTPLASVAYAGSIYSVPSDSRATYSPDSMTILKQLLALNLSATNLPTTAILSVTPTQ